MRRGELFGTARHILLGLVPRLCLGTHYLAGSAGHMPGGASRTVGCEADPRNPGVWTRQTRTAQVLDGLPPACPLAVAPVPTARGLFASYLCQGDTAYHTQHDEVAMSVSIDDSTMLDRFVQRAQTLYTLPAVAAEVLRLTADQAVDVDALSKCIERDPALTAKILGVVNSSQYGLGTTVTSLSQALTLLGTRSIKLLVLGSACPWKSPATPRPNCWKAIRATRCSKPWRPANCAKPCGDSRATSICRRFAARHRGAGPDAGIGAALRGFPEAGPQ